MTKTPEQYNAERIAAGDVKPAHVAELARFWISEPGNFTAAVRFWQGKHGLVTDGKIGPNETIPSIDHALETNQGSAPAKPPASGPLPNAWPTPPRGHLVRLTREQIIARALYLAGKASIDTLDEHIRRDANTPTTCPDLFYLLKTYNGGKDPTAPDPADRWSKDGSTFVNRTADCSGGNAWMHGFDRWQPRRMPQELLAMGWEGWWNTDSKILDAKSGAKCFRSVGRPEPGTIIVYATNGSRIGHEGTVVSYRGNLDEWDPSERALWSLIDVVDVAANHGRANTLHDGSWWFGQSSWFLESIMEP